VVTKVWKAHSLIARHHRDCRLMEHAMGGLPLLRSHLSAVPVPFRVSSPSPCRNARDAMAGALRRHLLARFIIFVVGVIYSGGWKDG
jgi:hypothetical protein